MSYQMIKYAENEAIATITLNRPEKYNTFRMEMIQELEYALTDANRNNEIKVIVLEGAGDSFCGGFDFSGGLEHNSGVPTIEHPDHGQNRAFIDNQNTLNAFMRAAVIIRLP